MSDALTTLAGEFDLGEYLPILQRYVLPCAAFTLEGAKGLPVGASRLGGGPDLPEDFAWPQNKGRPLDFVLQVNLADLAGNETNLPLPPAGILSFFYDLEDRPWGLDSKDLDGYAIRYFEPGVALHRHDPPHSKLALKEARLIFRPGLTLPDSEAQSFERLVEELAEEGLDPDEAADILIDLATALTRSGGPEGTTTSAHQIGGHPSQIQNDMQIEAEEIMMAAHRDEIRGRLKRADVKARAEQWTLLLQLDTDLDFQWGDEGMIYYWVRRDDLARLDFSRAWLSLQCF